MKKNTVAFGTIVVLGILEVAALFNGVNGEVFALVVGAITGTLGYVFGKNGDAAAKAGSKVGAALLLGLVAGTSGCAGVPVKVEVCVYHETYGKICASYVDGSVEISADAELPPELVKEIEEQIRKLAGK